MYSYPYKKSLSDGLVESLSQGFHNWECLKEGLPLSASIDGMLPVPPASTEDTQAMPLNPTIQPLDPLSWIWSAKKSLMLDVMDHQGNKVQKCNYKRKRKRK
jgi:hypothetical protein